MLIGDLGGGGCFELGYEIVWFFDMLWVIWGLGRWFWGVVWGGCVSSRRGLIWFGFGGGFVCVFSGDGVVCEVEWVY